MITVTKKFDFCYGHRLPTHPGKCRNQHGHNAILEVTIGGAMDQRTGMVEDFGDLKSIVETTCLEDLDHSYLNHFIENPTAENIILWILGSLSEHYGTRLVRLRLYETPDSFAEWTPNPA